LLAEDQTCFVRQVDITYHEVERFAGQAASSFVGSSRGRAEEALVELTFDQSQHIGLIGYGEDAHGGQRVVSRCYCGPKHHARRGGARPEVDKCSAMSPFTFIDGPREYRYPPISGFAVLRAA
jgi:hypothetical protein